jgi:hypothetical protein
MTKIQCSAIAASYKELLESAGRFSRFCRLARSEKGSKRDTEEKKKIIRNSFADLADSLKEIYLERWQKAFDDRKFFEEKIAESDAAIEDARKTLPLSRLDRLKALRLGREKRISYMKEAVEKMLALESKMTAVNKYNKILFRIYE